VVKQSIDSNVRFFAALRMTLVAATLQGRSDKVSAGLKPRSYMSVSQTRSPSTREGEFGDESNGMLYL
jgi:hypothetical protein